MEKKNFSQILTKINEDKNEHLNGIDIKKTEKIENQNKIQTLSILSNIQKIRPEYELSCKLKIPINSKPENINLLENESNNKNRKYEIIPSIINYKEIDSNSIISDNDLIQNYLFKNNPHSQNFIYNKSIIISPESHNDDKYTETDILNNIKDHFNSKNPNDQICNSTILILSCNMSPTGDFLYEGISNENNSDFELKFLTYNIIYDLWMKRENKYKNKFLLIILDCSYSEIWVDLCKDNMNYTSVHGISVQASCDKKQKTEYIENKGGLLLWNITQYNTNNENLMFLRYHDNTNENENENDDKKNTNSKKNCDKKEINNTAEYKNNRNQKNNNIKDYNYLNKKEDKILLNDESILNEIMNIDESYIKKDNPSKGIKIFENDRKRLDNQKNNILATLLDNNISIKNIIKQRPKSIGFYFIVLRQFYLDIMINSWEDYLRIKNPNKLGHDNSDENYKQIKNEEIENINKTINTDPNKKINSIFYRSICNIKYENGTYKGEVKNKIPNGYGIFETYYNDDKNMNIKEKDNNINKQNKIY